jgi:hypothetical protein
VFLSSVVNFLRRQAGDEGGEQIIDDVRCVRRDDRGVLVFGVLEITGQVVAAHQGRKVLYIPGIEPTRYQRRNVSAVLGAKLGARRWAGRMMTAVCQDRSTRLSVRLQRSRRRRQPQGRPARSP